MAPMPPPQPPPGGSGRRPPADRPDWAADEDEVAHCKRCNRNKPIWQFIGRRKDRQRTLICLDCREASSEIHRRRRRAGLGRYKAQPASALAPAPVPVPASAAAPAATAALAAAPAAGLAAWPAILPVHRPGVAAPAAGSALIPGASLAPPAAPAAAVTTRPEFPLPPYWQPAPPPLSPPQIPPPSLRHLRYLWDQDAAMAEAPPRTMRPMDMHINPVGVDNWYEVYNGYEDEDED